MEIEPSMLQYARRALRLAVRDHLYDPNVNLIDFGFPRDKEGLLLEDRLAVRFHVFRKYETRWGLEAAIERGDTQADLSEPIDVDGIRFETDVVQGAYRPHMWPWWKPRQPNARAVRADPMRGGISISDANHNAFATLGCKVIDRSTRAEMILSNWHVLVADWGAGPGLPIFQPGGYDGGTYDDTVATLTRDAMGVNLDAAVATLDGSRRLINDQLGLGPVSGVGHAQLGMVLVKSGRRTGITRGKVTAIEGIARINYGPVDRIIRHIVTIEPADDPEVSAPGDSGSLWCEAATMRAIALHFAGGDHPERGLALDIQPVLDALDVDMALGLDAPVSARAGRWRPAQAQAAAHAAPASAGERRELAEVEELVRS